MPDRRTHRSAAPEDRRSFAPQSLPALREAMSHLVWLENRGYSSRAALKLVGDHFSLTARQRYALQRCGCSDAQRLGRARKQVPFEALPGRTVEIDGFNVLITLETALGGGVVLAARDGCVRDLAHLRGTWRRVHETTGAVSLLGQVLAEAGVSAAHVRLDRRVSNSGRLSAMLGEIGSHWPLALSCETCSAVDARLKASERVVVTADSAILDACGAWANLAREAIERHVPEAFWVELSGGASATAAVE